jgi:hypothetical protein
MMAFVDQDTDSGGFGGYIADPIPVEHLGVALNPSTGTEPEHPGATRGRTG